MGKVKIFPLKKKLINFFLLILIILLPIIVRIANYSPNRIHGDDTISAFFSSNYNFRKDNFFAPVPINKAEWVCQFPSLYFVLQKIFFIFSGESLLTIKLSILPYVGIVSLMIFLISKKFFDTKTAAVGVILYSFFPASLYLETLGLHFISSTAVFLIFFYFLIIGSENNSFYNSILIGVSCAFCYFFYSSSYIALPIMFLFFFAQFFKKNNLKKNIANLTISIIGFIIVVSPFLINMYKEKNFYLAGRIKQVSIINGEWSGTKERIKNGESINKIVVDNFVLSFNSLYKNGIGGHGGYTFGHLALFDKFSILLIFAGLLSCLFLIFLKKKTELLFVLAIILMAFVSGMVLTIPPPPFHRFSIAFPFFVIIESSIFFILFKEIKISETIKYALTVFVLIVYSINNQNYFEKSIKDEKENMDVKISLFIKEKYPSRKVMIASFPGYALEKIMYFVINNKGMKTLIATDYHQNFIDKFDRNENYLYVLIFPDVFDSKFKELDKKGKLINFSNNYSIFVKP